MKGKLKTFLKPCPEKRKHRLFRAVIPCLVLFLSLPLFYLSCVTKPVSPIQEAPVPAAEEETPLAPQEETPLSPEKETPLPQEEEPAAPGLPEDDSVTPALPAPAPRPEVFVMEELPAPAAGRDISAGLPAALPDTEEVVTAFDAGVNTDVLTSAEGFLAAPGVPAAEETRGPADASGADRYLESAAVIETAIPVQPKIELNDTVPVPPAAAASAKTGTASPASVMPAAGARVRSIVARQGDAVSISLEGRGWLYLGEKNEKGGVEFLSRTTNDISSLFIFETSEPGDYSLMFQYQDFLTGSTASEEIAVKVAAKTDGTAAASNTFPAGSGLAAATLKSAETAPAPVPEKPAEPRQPGGTLALMDVKKLAEEYIKDRRYGDALNLYLKHEQEADPEITDGIARLYVRLNEPGKAREYFQKNRILENTLYREKAVAGLMGIGLAQKNQEIIDANLEPFLSISKIPVDAGIKSLAEHQLAAGYDSAALKTLETYLIKYPGGEALDWVYFTLGNLYETSTIVKDYVKSREYYYKVAEGFPLSLFWDRAKDRIQYLNRHFFNIR